jgi:DNA-binding transcriptional regulator GbsR (MarR family)
MSDKPQLPDPLTTARDEFISQWGAMGGAWGINRTMAQVHALLMTSEKALTTDDVMAELKISRGNAHQNLRELVGWGLVRNVIRKGERKEYFEQTRSLRGEKAAAFNRQIKALAAFLAQAEAIMDRVSKSEQSALMPLVLKMFAKTSK